MKDFWFLRCVTAGYNYRKTFFVVVHQHRSTLIPLFGNKTRNDNCITRVETIPESNFANQ